MLIALERAGSLPKMRLTGMLVGMKEVCPPLENCRVTYLDGDGKLGESFEAMRRHLRDSKARRLLVGAINDPSALGALRAFQEAGRADELRHHGTERVARRPRRAAPAGHAPDRLGRVLSRRSTAPRSSPSRSTSSTAAPVPPAVFVKHQLVTPENVDHIYPNDRLMQIAARREPSTAIEPHAPDLTPKARSRN